MTVFILGTLILVTALVASVSATLSYGMLIGGTRLVLPWARRSIWIASICTLLAAGILLTLFVLGRYEFLYVYQYSSTDLELRYKLSALWAGQQGSFMIWVLVGMLVAPLLITRSRVYEPYVLAPLMLLQSAILVLLLLQNPFRLRLDATGTIIHSPDGMGLNELLHNPWMVIHPPMLFLGYGLLAIPFAYAVGGLWRRDYDGWIRPALPWTIAAWVVLATALTFGGYWAYETLGWGGYWGWDPVENSSLVPWLTTSALLHGMLVQRVHGGLRRTNLILALVSYSLVIYASFLTRSGVLDNFSVHSFTASGLSIALIVVLVGTLGSAAAVLILRWRDIPVSPLADRFWSRDSLFVLGIMTFVLLALLIGMGTSMPVLSSIPGLRESLQSTFETMFAITTSVDGRFSLQAAFYQRVTPPLGVVVIALMTIAPLFGWRGGSLRAVLLAVRGPGAIAVLGVVVALMLGIRDRLGLLYVGFGVFAVGVNLFMILRTLRRGWLWIGGYVAHVGAAVLVIGVVGSTAYGSPEERMTIPVGETQRIHQYAVTFNGYRTHTTAQGISKGVLSLGIQRGSADEPTLVEPQLYVLPRNGQWLRTPGIVRSLTEDFYISPGEYLPEVNPNRTTMQQGQMAQIGPYRVLLQEVATTTHTDQTVTVAARLTLFTTGSPPRTITPTIHLVANTLPQALPVTLSPTHTLTLTAFDLGNRAIELDVGGLNLPIQPARADIVVSTKPAIRLVWIGTLIMTLGGSLAATRRFIEAHTRHSALVRANASQKGTVHPDRVGIQ